MQKLSFFSYVVSTTCSIPSILNREHLKGYSIKTRALKREHKFSLADYILTALVKMCNATEKSEFSLKSIHKPAYLKYYKNEGFPELIHKCIHKQLHSGRTFEAINLMLSELMHAHQLKPQLTKIKILKKDRN